MSHTKRMFSFFFLFFFSYRIHIAECTTHLELFHFCARYPRVGLLSRHRLALMGSMDKLRSCNSRLTQTFWCSVPIFLDNSTYCEKRSLWIPNCLWLSTFCEEMKSATSNCIISWIIVLFCWTCLMSSSSSWISLNAWLTLSPESGYFCDGFCLEILAFGLGRQLGYTRTKG